MFYQAEPDPYLRFGDVVKGYVGCIPEISSPFVSGNVGSYRVDVVNSTLMVVMSPCCSIGDRVLSLAVLREISPSFYKNPYLEEDFTRINRKMVAEKSVPPNKWANMPQAQREAVFRDDIGYAFSDWFVYQAHPFLPKYTLNKKGGAVEIGHHMIDFKTCFSVNCPTVKKPEDSPAEAKVLQLSVQSRTELREKVASYFARTPDEDIT